MPKGYWIVRVDVKDEEPVKRYVAGNHPIFEKFGGRYLVRAQKFAVPKISAAICLRVLTLASKLKMRCSETPLTRPSSNAWRKAATSRRAILIRGHEPACRRSGE